MSIPVRLLDILDRVAQVSLASKSMEDVVAGVLDLILEFFNADRAGSCIPAIPMRHSGKYIWNIRGPNGRSTGAEC
jgi:hypothetical protein